MYMAVMLMVSHENKRLTQMFRLWRRDMKPALDVAVNAVVRSISIVLGR